MKAPNLIYVLGPLSLSPWQNNEIRYSLRSMEPANPAWAGIAGPEVPPFLSGVHHIKIDVDMSANRYRNTQSQILAACSDPSVPEELLLMNDDFMVRTPKAALELLPTHRRPIGVRETGNIWKKTIINTATWLQSRGIGNPICYEGHTPFPFLKSKAKPLLEELLKSKEILQFRTAYGNVNIIGGNLHPNAKRDYPDKWPEGSPFWSLKGDPSEKAKKFLESWLNKPSRWEASTHGVST